MRDACEEEMMGDMSVGDVMEKSVDAESVGPVDGLHLTLDIVPIALLVDLDVFVLVLKVGDAHEPEALEQQRDVVVLDERVDTPIAKVESNQGTHGAEGSANDALKAFRIVREEFTVRIEVTSVWKTHHRVHGIPSEESGKREFGEVPLEDIARFVVGFGDPRVTFVLVNMRRVLMVLTVGLLPRPIRRQNRRVRHVAKEVVHPRVVGEGRVAAIVSDTEQRRAEHPHEPVPCEKSEESEMFEI